MGKGEIDIRMRAEQLGLDIDNLAGSIEQEFLQAIRDTTQGAYAKIVAAAQEQLNTTQRDYLKGLRFEEIGPNQYLITLDGSFANALEGGKEAYDMRAAMLRSTKMVEIGSRAGQPWVQKGKQNQKYAHVPMEKKPFTKNPKMADMAAAIRQLEAYNQSGRRQKITKVFKDPSGKALQGKVATVNNFSGLDKTMKNLEGLVKYQKVSKNEKTGKERVESVYINYRTVSENGKPWMHPGIKGIHAFEQAEQWLDKEIDNILKHFLG